MNYSSLTCLCGAVVPKTDWPKHMRRGKLVMGSRCRECLKARDRTPRTRYSQTRSKVRRETGMEFLTYDIWHTLIQLPCHYCQGPLPELGKGVDRIDPNARYTTGNCVPCCGYCNQTKSNVLTYIEMMQVGAVFRVIREAREARGEKFTPYQAHLKTGRPRKW